MIKALSYMFAVILTFAIAIILYPIAGIFWVLGLFGKIADFLFNFTKKVLSSIWREMREMGNPNPNPISNPNPNVNFNPNSNPNFKQNSVPNNNININKNNVSTTNVNTWKCSCGALNTGYFCRECGKKKN